MEGGAIKARCDSLLRSEEEGYYAPGREEQAAAEGWDDYSRGWEEQNHLANAPREGYRGAKS